MYINKAATLLFESHLINTQKQLVLLKSYFKKNFSCELKNKLQQLISLNR